MYQQMMGTNQPVISYINITTIKYFKWQYLHFHRKFQSLRPLCYAAWISSFIFLCFFSRSLFIYHLIAFEFKWLRCRLGALISMPTTTFNGLETFSTDTKRYLLIKVLQ